MLKLILFHLFQSWLYFTPLCFSFNWPSNTTTGTSSLSSWSLSDPFSVSSWTTLNMDPTIVTCMDFCLAYSMIAFSMLKECSTSFILKMQWSIDQSSLRPFLCLWASGCGMCFTALLAQRIIVIQDSYFTTRYTTSSLIKASTPQVLGNGSTCLFGSWKPPRTKSSTISSMTSSLAQACGPTSLTIFTLF